MKFEAMFRTIHGYDPFPWQSEAAKRLVDTNTDLSINVPTASGKTALIDAAIYSAYHGGPRRVMFIIDRRVVVDEAYLRAKRIARAMDTTALAPISKTLGPIKVVRLRGGVQGDDDWVLYPEYTTIIVSTVDQIGSRLLHRGYGVSPRMAPVHAGFVGHGAIYIVDEAHLSVPLVETVNKCKSYGATIRQVMMTATPVSQADAVIELSDQDLCHPVLKQRLTASKKARLISAPGKENEFFKIIADAAEGLSNTARIVGVVVNRVATARRVWEILSKKKHETVLLTGRVRPYDRDQLMNRLLPKIKAGRQRTEGPPLFVVTTQTIEVGADIDFDGLVTEAAPLDSLRQRFGRLDRLGELQKAQGIIIYREQKGQTPPPDPVYGEQLYETWQWLQSIAYEGEVDFGILAMAQTIQKNKPLASKPKHASSLLPSHIKILCQTGLEAPYVDVSAWLHGPQSSPSDISIIWRSDFGPDLSSQLDALRLRPPISREAIQIPVYAARSWLLGQRPADLSDLEGVAYNAPASEASDKVVLRWRGVDDIEPIEPRDMRPGDTIIVPSTFGGCDQYGWSPADQSPVADIADYCSLDRFGSAHIVRLVPALMDWLGSNKNIVWEAVNEVQRSETTIDPERGIDLIRLQAAHQGLRGLIKGIKHPLLENISKDGQYSIELHPLGVVLRSRAKDEVDGSIMSGVAVELDDHLNGVAKTVGQLAQNHPEMETICRAAQFHDLGKKEPRFQIMLHGNPILAAAGPELAKSGLRRLSEKMAAYKQSGVPKGFRHELCSMELADIQEPLVRHLIATHHGFGRPWFPMCLDPDVIGAQYTVLGSGWGASFAKLANRYGPWALANMEMLLRASDARRSMAEQGG